MIVCYDTRLICYDNTSGADPELWKGGQYELRHYIVSGLVR